jgi:aminodeoxyfutalosine synthase
VDHLRLLRALQDETGGFTGFVPLPYQPENNALPVSQPPTGFDALRTLAVSRLYLDNFDHLTAYWVGLGMKLAQVALSFGADDLHGTIVEEHIFRLAGAANRQFPPEAELAKAIQEAGLPPVQRDSHYRPIRVWDGTEPAEAPAGDKASPLVAANLATG